MAQTTKRALAASLKKLLAEKPLDHITVVDIADDCEVNRQTFYYHFKDIRDLVEGIYTSEATRALEGKKTYDTWQQGFLQIFEYVQHNRAFVSATFHSADREQLERYLHHETYQLLFGVVEELAVNTPVREDDKAFIARFYEHAFVGLMIEWIRSGMREEPDRIVDRLSTMIHGDIAAALDRFRTRKANE